MHIEGTESSSEASQPENRNIVTAIEDLQRSQAAMWAEFQSLRQGTFIPQATQGGQGPRGSPYLTREDITAILFEAKKVENTVYIDTKPPYSKEISSKPYLANYTPPTFPKYDGMAGNARKHIRRYIDALTAHSYDHELRIREFSKSLEGHAFTWYHKRCDHHAMDCYALKNIFHERVAKGDLVIKGGKRADPRISRPEVAMTFFTGREIPWKKKLRIWLEATQHPRLYKMKKWS
nr:hypothetical protein CFP56_06391 [Quercus suber]